MSVSLATSIKARARRFLGLRDLSRAYKEVFVGVAGPLPYQEMVLADLRDFCGARVTTAKVSAQTRAVDPLASAVAEGRRQVWLRIEAAVNLNESKLGTLRTMEELVND